MHGRKQRTLKNTIRCVGIGLHDGQRVEVTLKPGKPDQGIIFRRVGAATQEFLPALWSHADSDDDNAILGHQGEAAIRGVEQLLSAVAGAELDNLEVEIDGDEIPILDGSAEPYFFLLSCAGLVEQDVPSRHLRILQAVEVRRGHRYARLEPYDGFALDVELDDINPLIGHQHWSGDITINRYHDEIARARIFTSEENFERLRSEGRLKGKARETFLIIGAQGILSAEGLRYPDEPVRHKVLEIIGDLRMAGAPLQGRFIGKDVDHRLVLMLLERLFSQPKAWEWREGDSRVRRDNAFEH